MIYSVTVMINCSQADHLAAGLLQLGLNPGDRVAIWGPNSSQWYISRLAAARGGFIAVSRSYRT
jgi:fatty-acyl-CoA synthase